ncbi:REP-associated tyrosine transposase [Synoicihabitans lomoniglobus]|uniref:Transposase IS200-like domain-containing protein n=1 Tax=Synoicihabitans lomoniglobus TaxID=2909285 RepID=A0AAF0CRC1_9BACT|nr:hypothetical protein [Opitutaceae bacterium LMO-M01]WED66619.1 hypothetical protein PXH66_07120 [Opitutaceae bacterium LMO-M01]
MSDPESEAVDLPPRRKILGHTPPAWIGSGATYFITICTIPRKLNQLAIDSTANAIFEAVTHRHEHHRWHCRLMLLMPDHLHALIAFSSTTTMKSEVAGFKRFVARHTGVTWQRDFFDHRIRDAENLQEKARYIRQNPVRAKLVKHRKDWPYIWSR